MSERWRRVEEVFAAARAARPAERQALLDSACGDDAELRHEVVSLLAAAETTGAVDHLDSWLAPLRGGATAAAEPAPGAAAAPEAEAGDPPRAARDRLGPYEVLGELGRGGMGVVYRALDPRLRREVAVKVLHPHLAADRALADRLIAEARAASALDHPHVCTVHELGHLDDGRLYVAMAYYAGGSLAERLERGPLAVADAVRIAAQVAAGLHRAHEAGLVHRDVKPANVGFNLEGEPKVLDFGIAKLVGSGATLPGMLVGTPRYMAPEQLRAEPVDRRADVWALGALLYEMLAGRPAFDGDDLEAVRGLVLAGEPPPLRDVRPDLPPGVLAAVRRALAKDPTARPPSAEVFAELLLGGLAEDPTPHLLPLRPAALPAALTSFVGRDRELARLRELLPGARLVTLTGPAGTGKTRLAVEAARERAAAGAEVCWVGLADLHEPGLVPAAILAAVAGGAGGGAREPLAALAATIGERSLLLVLDNLEHLSAAAPALAELLARCPRLALLTTSRGPLRIGGEVELAVPPLAVGEAAAAATADAPAAVRLFLERARATAPDFGGGAGDADRVAAICRLLDGLPLALELAAARARLFSASQMLAELRQRLDLPGAGPRDRPARHRSLGGALGWSYDLLAPDHQRLFRALAVFRGGFTLEQAHRVTGFGRAALADGVDALLDQSLLSRLPGGDEPRFALLETLRRFAVERLRESGEEAAAVACHRRTFLTLVERAAPELEAGAQREWLERLERDQDNLRAALDEGPALTADLDLRRRLAAGLWRFWLARGQLHEGLARLENLLAGPPPEDPAVRLALLRGAATLSHNVGRNDRARDLLAAARELCHAAGDEANLLHVLNNLAWVGCEVSELAAAESIGREALELARRRGDLRAEAVALNNLGWVALYREQWDEARRCHEQSLARRRAVGDLRGEGFALVNLAWTARGSGDLEGSAALLDRADAVIAGLGDLVYQPWSYLNRAALLLARGLAGEAFQLLSGSAWRESGNASLLAEAHMLRAVAARQIGRADQAEELLAAALALWEACGSRLGRARCLAERAAVAALSDGRHEAERRWREALAAAEELGTPSLVARARAALEGPSPLPPC
jgi:non-specific serine/threonine protein kinase